MDFPLYFKNVIWPWKGHFFDKKKNSEKAKPPKIGISFGGSMPIAQIWEVPNNTSYPPLPVVTYPPGANSAPLQNRPLCQPTNFILPQLLD